MNFRIKGKNLSGGMIIKIYHKNAGSGEYYIKHITWHLQ